MRSSSRRTRAARIGCARKRGRGRSSAPPKKRALTRADIQKAAELYATTSPAVIRCGWGQERNRNGGNASLAILALPAVAESSGVRGGGYAMSNSSAWGITRNWVPADEPRTRIVNMNQLGRALTEYDDSAGEDAVRLQLERRRHLARPDAACCAGWSARICSRSCSTR